MNRKNIIGFFERFENLVGLIIHFPVVIRYVMLSSKKLQFRVPKLWCLMVMSWDFRPRLTSCPRLTFFITNKYPCIFVTKSWKHLWWLYILQYNKKSRNMNVMLIDTKIFLGCPLTLFDSSMDLVFLVVRAHSAFHTYPYFLQ